VYVPEADPNYSAVGLASWYGSDFHGRYTANGEIFDKDSISAAHPTLPLPSYARVTNLANNRSIIVRVNDRGPYAHGRLIDLSVKTAHLLGFHSKGTAKVKVEYVGKAPLAGSDDRKLMATLREGGPAEVPVQVASANGWFVPSVAERRRSGQGAPIPAERPYRLGEGEGEGAELAAAEPPQTALEPQPAVPAAAFAPASIFSPARYSGPGYMSGRGLY
jgi:rare lipoprotein A